MIKKCFIVDVELTLFNAKGVLCWYAYKFDYMLIV